MQMIMICHFAHGTVAENSKTVKELFMCDLCLVFFSLRGISLDEGNHSDWLIRRNSQNEGNASDWLIRGNPTMKETVLIGRSKGFPN